MNPVTPISRLAREVQRLYLPLDASLPGSAASVRALVLEVCRPAAWQPLGAVWQGVQAELGLPAPAIAVNGSDGLQLWFSLAEPVDAAQGRAFLSELRVKYMPEILEHRVGMHAAHTPDPIPRLINADGQWSAFVASDLAPLFEASPWLDMAPSAEGQADLLARLVSIQRDSFDSALRRLQAGTEAPVDPSGGTAHRAIGTAGHPAAAQFLLQVMNDTAAPLAVRVEAAKALMPYGRAG